MSVRLDASSAAAPSSAVANSLLVGLPESGLLARLRETAVANAMATVHGRDVDPAHRGMTVLPVRRAGAGRGHTSHPAGTSPDSDST
jgi:hypothetical protein